MVFSGYMPSSGIARSYGSSEIVVLNRISFEMLQILRCYSVNSLSTSREVYKSTFMEWVGGTKRKGNGKGKKLI